MVENPASPGWAGLARPPRDSDSRARNACSDRDLTSLRNIRERLQAIRGLAYLIHVRPGSADWCTIPLFFGRSV